MTYKLYHLYTHHVSELLNATAHNSDTPTACLTDAATRDNCALNETWEWAVEDAFDADIWESNDPRDIQHFRTLRDVFFQLCYEGVTRGTVWSVLTTLVNHYPSELIPMINDDDDIR